MLYPLQEMLSLHHIQVFLVLVVILVLLLLLLTEYCNSYVCLYNIFTTLDNNRSGEKILSFDSTIEFRKKASLLIVKFSHH
jgi:hypothetical protein